MAMLEKLDTGEVTLLCARHLIGRNRACMLQIDSSSVSEHHAQLEWDGSGWTVRDLGSRNGTFVNGQRLDPGIDVELHRGDELALANDEHRFRLVDETPPRLMGIAADGTIALGDDDLLCLPSEQALELMILRAADGRWLVEPVDGPSVEVGHDHQLVAGGRSWRLLLPDPAARTRGLTVGPLLEDCTFCFYVSRDGEHIELSVERGVDTWKLEPRAHLELFLTLARARQADAAAGSLPASECGWVYRDELARRIGIKEPLINLWTHRARQQLAELGLLDAERSIERRLNSTALRLGITNFQIQDA